MSSENKLKSTKFHQEREDTCSDVSADTLQYVLQVLNDANQQHSENNIRLYEAYGKLTGHYSDSAAKVKDLILDGLIQKLLDAAYQYKELNNATVGYVESIWSAL